MSRLSNTIVAQREEFVKSLFRQDPPYTITEANNRLANKDGFGLNKKMALKRIYELREEVRAEAHEVVVPGDATCSPVSPVVVSGPISPEAVAAINAETARVTQNSECVPVVFEDTQPSTPVNSEEASDFLAAIA